MLGRPRLPVSSPEQERLREQQRQANKRAREKRRPEHRRLIDEFLGRPCVDCHGVYPRAAMHPDHVRGKKYQKISWFYYGHGSTKKLIEELAKCDPRCANCHCIRHAAEEAA